MNQTTTTQKFPALLSESDIYFHQTMTPTVPHYNLGATTTIGKKPDIEKLTQAIELVLKHSEFSRNYFEFSNGRVERCLMAENQAKLNVLDYSGKTVQEIDDYLTLQIQTPFELSQTPLCRFYLIKQPDLQYQFTSIWHHLLSDGYGYRNFLIRLGKVYSDMLENNRIEESACKDPAPIASIGLNEEKYQNSKQYQKSGQYWLNKFESLPEPLLTTAYPAKDEKEELSSSGRIIRKIDSDKYKNIANSAYLEGTTPFHLFLGLFYVYFTRCFNKEEFVCGFPIHNRRSAAQKNTVCTLSSVSPTRVKVEKDVSFKELLTSIGNTLKQDYRHQRYPISALNRDLQLLATDRKELFEITFSYEQLNDSIYFGKELSSTRTLCHGYEQTPLAICLKEYDQGEEVQFDFHYNYRYFSDSDAELLVDQLLHLFHETPHILQCPINKINLLSKTETTFFQQQNSKKVFSPDDLCIHEIFERQVKKDPAAVAVWFENENLTYGALNQAANRLAQHLIDLCVKPETPVAICFHRSFDMVIAILAVMKAGGTYLPIDPDYPTERQQHMLKDSGAAIVLSHSQVETTLPVDESQRINLDDPELIQRLKSRPNSNPERELTGISADRLAYIIYTSGSTGVPKGVMITHKNLNSFLTTMRKVYEIKKTDRMLQFASISFDTFVEEFFMPLTSGATMVLRNDSVMEGVMRFREFIHQQDVSVMSLPTAFWHSLCDDLERLDESPQNWKPRLTILGGEAVSRKRVESWRKYTGGDGRLLNTYGPSEGTIVSTVHDITDFSETNKEPPIGKPIKNTKCYVLDNNLEPLPVNVAGELHIAGSGIGRGYLNRPELTAEKFVNNPYGTNEEDILYKTGDLVRWKPDGNLEFVGRVDHQVKIRGFRIELGEIESRLLEDENLRDAVVLAREENPGNKELVAYIVRKEGVKEKELIPSVRERLKSVLPNYMIPTLFLELEVMPLTANGKINRKALPAPNRSNHLSKVFEVPATQMEAKLLPLWKEVLKKESVSVTDNFFEIGGHSLMATTLVSRIRQELSIDLKIKTLFSLGSIRKLANEIDCNQRRRTLPKIEPVSREQQLPLSFGQQRLYFLDQFENGSNSYNMPFSLDLKGTLDYEALNRSLRTIIQRHEILRTRFDRQDEKTVQKVQESVQFELKRSDLTELPPDEQKKRVAEHTLEEVSQIFDLTSNLMLRGELIRLAEDHHILMLTMHHIASDGWSINILCGELSQLYAAFINGEPSPLKPLAIQYSDYAYWQRAWLNDQQLESDLAYWKEQLQGIPEVHSLPTDRPRPTWQDYSGANFPWQLSKELSQSLNNLYNSHGVTLFMLLQSALSVLMARYSGEEDIVIGTPIAGRTEAELEPLIGLFVNTLVLRSDLSENPTFIDLLRQTQTRTIDAYDHQHTPFEQLVELLQPERNTSHNPLFQVMLSLQNNEETLLTLPGITIELRPSSLKSTQFDLILECEEKPDGLLIDWEYSTALFDQSTIKTMAGHMEILLQSIVKTPDRSIWQLPMLSDSEKGTLLNQWTQTEHYIPTEQCVHEVFEACVTSEPESVAVVFQNETLTYGELNRRANQLARYLIDLNVQPEQPVAISFERSFELPVAIMAVMKAGGAWLPIDPTYPVDRQQHMLKDASVEVVLTLSSLVEKLPVDDQKTICLDDPTTMEKIHLQSEKNLKRDETGIKPDNLAYIIYTSGSTGLPKGVMINHKNLNSFLNTMRRVYSMGKTDRMLQFASISFDTFVEEIFMPLTSGAAMVLRNDTVMEGALGLRDFLKQNEVSVMTLPTAYWHSICDDLERLNEPQQGWKPRLTILGGEAVSRKRVEFWRKYMQGEGRLLNTYGPSECSIVATVFDITDYIETTGEPPIGKPVENTRCYVLGKGLEPVPPNVAGELYIAGSGVGRGYLNRPELTEERFLNNPFGNSNEDRLYRTGDLVRWRADGNLEFIGRIDNQVKIRGFRIELGEIESRLLEDENIRDAVVLAREDNPGNKELVAYIVRKEEVEEKDLIPPVKERLKSVLPNYMIPALFVELEVMPLTANGKVNRKALPAPDQNDYRSEQFEVPCTETEAKLLPLWKEILKKEMISVTDNFFEIGGHSLLATTLVSRIRLVLSVDLKIKTLFSAGTIRDLAKVIDQERKEATVPKVEAVSREQQLPLSFGQQRLYFLDQFENGSKSYNMPIALRLKGAVDYETLNRSLNAIIQRHEVLRTRFEQQEGKSVQNVWNEATFHLKKSNLSDLSPEEQEKRVEFQALEEANRVFDLTSDLMLRGELIRLAEDHHVLLLTMHHIASDGWSINILCHELSQLYTAFLNGAPSPLEPLKIQYPDYAHWQRTWLDEQQQESDLTYWKEQLQGIPEVHSLPTDRPRPTWQDYSGANLPWQLSKELSQSLNELCKSHGVTLFMLLQSALSVLMARYSGEEDIVIGTPIAGRTQAELEPLIGLFVNTLVLRSDLSDNPTFADLLRQTQNRLIDAYDHQHTPFEQLVELLQPERNTSHNPLFQVMLSLQNNEETTLNLPGVDIELLPASMNITQFDLTLECEEKPDGLLIEWEYSTALFDQSTIETMAGHMEVLLQSIVKTPNRSVWQLPILSDSEKETLLNQWTQTEHYIPTEQCVHEVFEACVTSEPESVAVVFENETLTYGELNRRANQLARYLIELNVQPEQPVAISFERSFELPVAILAVMKAGGAWLPIDPTYPVDRQQHMLKDAAVEVILTLSSLVEKLPVGDQKTICLDDPTTMENLYLQSEKNLKRDETGTKTDSLAYIIYTSGSTGLPKGVMINHKNLNSFLNTMRKVYSMGKTDRMLQFASISFDTFVEEIFMPLTSGAAMVLRNDTVMEGTLGLRDFLKQNEVSVMTLPTAYWHSICDDLERLNEPQQGWKPRLTILGGEAVSRKRVESWRRYMQGEGRLLNTYGPSECSIVSTVFDITDYTETIGEPPIGKPVENTRCYVLGKGLEPVPTNVAGELYIAGSGVGRGYLNRPELTEERFIKNPFGNSDEDRLYKTGDLVRWRTDGNLEFVGRVDHQVKIRGFRIELGEIESRLLEDSNLRDAVVLAREDSPGNKELVAYIVRKEEVEEKDLIPSVKERLKSVLPNYMIPTLFVELEVMPLTANGKVNRKALPAPDRNESSSDSPVAPRNQMEETLHALWQEVLQRDRIGIHDNFFTIGGDSIVSIQVISRAKQLGLGLTTRQLFEHQTIAELAPHVQRKKRVDATQEAIAGTMPLLPIQKDFFESESVDLHHYNQAVLLETTSEFTPEALRAIVESIYQRHDALRLRFHKQEESWVAEHHPFSSEMVERSITIEQIHKESKEEFRETLNQRCETIQQGLNLSSGPLFRAALFRIEGESKGRLLIVIHHLVVDGVSWRVLLEDINRAWEQFQAKKEIVLPPKSTAYSQWANRLIDYGESGITQMEKEFWVDALQQPVESLPVDHPEVEHSYYRSIESIEISLTQQETQKLLSDAHNAYHTQINDLLLASLLKALHDWSGNRSIRIDLEGHGREELFDDCDLSQTVGWFTTVYPLALISENPNDLDSLIKTVKEQYRAIPTNGIGYGVLRYLVENPYICALEEQNPSQISFNYLGQFDQSVDEEGGFSIATEPYGESVSPNHRQKYELDINGMVAEGKLKFSIDYSGERYDKATIESLGQLLEMALKSLIEHCEKQEISTFTPSDFPLAEVTQQELDEWLKPYPAVENLYISTPMQHGMLYHGMTEQSEDVYLGQLSLTLLGSLDPEKFRDAWKLVVAEQDILRTAFIGPDTEKPHQIVLPTVELPFRIEDWSNLSSEEQSEQFETQLLNDKALGFDFEQPPLMRLALFLLGENRYRLLWTTHHTILDGWSVPILFGAIMAHYEALLRNEQPVPIKAPKFQEYIRWMKEQDYSKGQEFWKNRLAGFSAPTPLVVDNLPIDHTDDGESREKVRKLSKEITDRLRQIAQNQQVTVNNIVQAAWSILLYNYSGETDLLFGTTVSGRPASLEGVESMVGLFINTLPTRIKLTPEMTVETLIKNLQQEHSENDEYNFMPLVEIQRLSEIQNGVSLFDSIVVFENYPLGEAMEKNETDLIMEETEGLDSTNFKLTLQVDLAEVLEIGLGYRDDLFSEETIDRMLRHYETILTEISTDEKKQVRAINMLSEPEKKQLLVDWCQTEHHKPNEQCVHERIEAQAKENPNTAAVIHEGEELTYDELNRQANRLARYLVTQGVRPETPVAISFERCLEMVIAIFGIMKAGGTWLPIDPSYPADRQRHMLNDSAVGLILTHSTVAEKLPVEAQQLLLIDDSEVKTELGSYSDSNMKKEEVGITANHLAYMIYTSGSTGLPKGVMITHKNLNSFLYAVQEIYSIRKEDRVLQFASISFDTFVEEVFMPLTSGATMVLRNDRVMEGIEGFCEFIQENRISVMSLPTAYWHSVCDELEREGKVREGWKPELTILGGEAVNRKRVESWKKYMQGDGRLLNTYGPSEGSIVATVFDITDYKEKTGEPSIGKATGNTRCYVLNQELKPVPINVPGELHIAGSGIGRGYLNRPELTAEKFIPNPYGNTPEDRLYKTGDLVRWRADGNLEFIGRIDNQVKIRGFRIELGEIENRLMEDKCIENAVVLARQDGSNEKQLVAYVVRKNQSETELPISDIKSRLKETLPDYMIPSLFMELETIPLTTNGKVDRKALPAPDKHSYGTKERLELPVTATEQDLLEIWKETLKLEEISVTENFFELGGHSLLATSLISRVRKAMGIDLPIRTLFATGTVRGLAAEIDSEKNRIRAPKIETVSREKELPLSFAQYRLWFIDQFEGSSEHYNMPIALHLTGTLNSHALERTLDTIVQRHETLRTVFSKQNGQAVQTIQGNVPFKLNRVDLTELAAKEQEEALNNIVIDEAQYPFDLSKDLMLRGQLITLGQQSYALLLTMHHIASDGWSFNVFAQELEELYQAFSLKQPSPLAPLEIQYADYSVWQRQWLRDERLEKELNYWKEHLKGIPEVHNLPIDRPRQTVPDYSGAVIADQLSPELSQALKEFCSERQITLFMLLQSALAILISQYGGDEDVVIGTPIAGRTRAELEPLIGLFVNTLVLRTDLSGNPTFTDLLKQVSHNVMNAYEYQHVPFEQLVEALKPKRTSAHTPLFQIMLSLQNNEEVNLSLPGIAVEPIVTDEKTAQFELTLECEESEEGLTMNWEYSTALFNKETIERMSAQMGRLLLSIVATPDQPIRQLSTLPESDKELLAKVIGKSIASTPDHGNNITEFEAPKTDTEKELANIWKIVLNREQISVIDDFFEIGGHSLLSIQLISRIHQQWEEAEIPLKTLFENPTVRALATIIDRAEDPEESISTLNLNDEINSLSIVSWKENETPLSEGIKRLEAIQAGAEVETVLLTGSTGFVGAFLLRELMEKFEKTVIYCFSRAKNEQALFERIRQNMERYGLWQEQYHTRIVPVLGDLTQPGLGMDQSTWKELESKVEWIIHNGSFVNHIMPYSELKQANVHGTEELLKLAMTERLKTFSYISTIDIFAENEQRSLVNEETPIEHEIHREDSGYAASKWVAENLVTLASDRGLPCHIYRLGRVSADSQTGAANRDDILGFYLRSCMELRSYPDADLIEEMAPVDIVARAIVSISSAKAAISENFHLTGKQAISWNDILSASPNNAWQKVLPENWLELVEQRSNTNNPLPITPYLFSLKEDLAKADMADEESREEPQDQLIDQSQTEAVMNSHGIEYPELTQSLWQSYWK